MNGVATARLFPFESVFSVVNILYGQLLFTADGVMSVVFNFT